MWLYWCNINYHRRRMPFKCFNFIKSNRRSNRKSVTNRSNWIAIFTIWMTLTSLSSSDFSEGGDEESLFISSLTFAAFVALFFLVLVFLLFKLPWMQISTFSMSTNKCLWTTVAEKDLVFMLKKALILFIATNDHDFSQDWRLSLMQQ